MDCSIWRKFYNNLNQTSPQECSEDLKTFMTCWNVNQEKKKTPPLEDIKVTGWFAVWHCILPFLGIFIVSLSMNYHREMNKCSKIPKGPDLPQKYRQCRVPFQILWKLGYLLYLLISLVPIPALTNIFMFYLKVTSHCVRSKPLFRTEMGVTEGRIQKYEALGTLEKIISFIPKLLYSFISFI